MVLWTFYFCVTKIKMHYFSGILALAVAVGALYGFTDVFPANELAAKEKQVEASHKQQSRVR